MVSVLSWGGWLFLHVNVVLRNPTQEQEKKERLKGIDAQKANIAAARQVSDIMRSSLGPRGMDKMLQSGDGDVTISKYGYHT